MIARGLTYTALLLALAHCAADPAGSEVDSTSREVISGTDVVPGDYPWLVFTGGCTGALISPEYVLTAAHCYGYAERNSAGTLEGIAFSSGPVAIGHPDLNSRDARPYAVSDVLLHPEYVKLTRDEVWGREPYDIALLRLAEPVYIDDYLRLPTRQPDEGERVRVAGWGLTEVGRVAHAREAVLEVRPRRDCFAGDEKRFCTRGGPDEPSANIGAGDSGGPVFVADGDGFMGLGINSTSNGASENTFASHAATFALIDWVLEATDGAFFCPDDDPANGCVALVDECSLGLDDCGTNATCEDLELGFGCACDPGYAGDGWTCDDVDECVAGSHDCSPDAVCTNTPGGFTCACALGFLGDGANCEPVPTGCSARGTSDGLPLAGCVLVLGLLARRWQREAGRAGHGTGDRPG